MKKVRSRQTAILDTELSKKDFFHVILVKGFVKIACDIPLFGIINI